MSLQNEPNPIAEFITRTDVDPMEDLAAVAEWIVNLPIPTAGATGKLMRLERARRNLASRATAAGELVTDNVERLVLAQYRQLTKANAAAVQERMASLVETRSQVADPAKAAAFLEQYGKNLEAAGFSSADALKACQIIFETKVAP